MNELRKLLHLIETDDEDEGLNIELKSHFSHPNPDSFRDDENDCWIITNNKRRIEFKSERAIQNYFRQICLKTIAAFLNTTGGKLFIGVSDKIDETGRRKIFGVNHDDNFSRDRYKLDMLDYLESNFSQNYVSKYINIEFVNIGSIYVCVVDVLPITNDLPALVTFDNKEGTLFVRLDNRTVKKTSTIDLILFGRDFWNRNEKLNPSSPPIVEGLPSGWVGPFELEKVELDEEKKIVSLHLRNLNKPVLCKFPNKYFSLGAMCKSLEGRSVILTSTGRYTVQSGYFSDIQIWE